MARTNFQRTTQAPQQASNLPIPRVAIVVLFLLALSLLLIPVGQKWYNGWIEIEVSGSETAEIFVITNEGVYDKIGEGSVRFSEPPGSYSFAAREDRKESLITVTSERFSIKKASIDLVAGQPATDYLPVQAEALHAELGGIAYLDPESNGLFYSQNKNSFPETIFGDLPLIDLAQITSINSGVFVDKDDQLRFSLNGETIALTIPEEELSENNFRFSGATPVSLSSSGALAMMLDGTLYYYESLTDTNPTAIARKLNQNAIIRLSDQGAVAVIESIEVNPDEEQSERPFATLQIINSSSGDIINAWLLGETDAPLTGEWSQNGTTFLFSTAEGLYSIKSGQDELNRLTAGLPDIHSEIEWIDSTRAAVSLGSEIWIYDTTTNQLQRLYDGVDQIHPRGGMSFDNGILFFATRDVELIGVGNIKTIRIP